MIPGVGPGLKRGGPHPLFQKKRQMSYYDTPSFIYLKVARFYADDFPYRAWHIGPFRGWQRERRVRHYLAVESPAVSSYRGDFRVFDVLQRVKMDKI